MLVVGNKLQTKVFKDIKIGTPFYRYIMGHGNTVLYMKTTEIFSNSDGYPIPKRYNVVNIENGELEAVSDDALVVIANVHVECNSKI